MWKTSTDIIPIVVGALGAVVSLDEYMSMVHIGKREVDRVQLSDLFKSTKILRKVLDISGKGF